MDTRKLIKIVDTIVTLKAKLRCPICLDVMQEGIELECSHKYCKECFLKHKSTQKQASCPLCKRILKRRSPMYTDEYENALGKFVYDCCDNIKSVYNCEVEQLQRQLREGLCPQTITSVLQQSDGNYNYNFAVPSTSKDDRFDQIVKQPCLPKEKYGAVSSKKAKVKQAESVKENCESAFDKLMHVQPTINFNKKGTKRVYGNKKKVEKHERKYNVLEFDDYENKTRVQQWLNDTRNKFDRLSQTQTIVGDRVSEISINDLPSISQLKRNKNDLGNVFGKRTLGSNSYKRRAKSLDIEIKKTKPQMKRFSLAKSISCENYDIEDINTEEEEVVKKAEEKVILDLIENEFLDKLETELEDQFDVKTKIDRRSKQKKLLSPTSTTGWERLTKMKKTMNKTKKSPKQLNITLQPTQERNMNENKAVSKSSTKNVFQASDGNRSKKMLKICLTREETNDNGQNIKGNEKMCIENKTRPPERNEVIETMKSEKMSPANKSIKQSYDLEKLEDYIAKNMEIINTNTNDSITSNENPANISSESNLVCDTVNIVERPPCSSENHKNKDRASEDKDNSKNVNSTRQPEVLEKDESDCVLLDVLFNTPTQKNKSIAVNDEITDEAPQNSKEDNQPTPINVEREKDDSCNDIEKLYNCATQKVNHTCGTNSVENAFGEEHHNSAESLLRLVESSLETCVRNLKSTDMRIENLRTLQLYVSKLKSLYKKSDSVIIEKVAKREFCNIETQTVVDTNDKTIQTVVDGKDMGIQTESFLCVKCSFNLTENKLRDEAPKIGLESKTDVVPKIDFKPTVHTTLTSKNDIEHDQNDILTCTLDNLNFETQDVVMKRGVITSISKRKNSQENKTTQKGVLESKLSNDVSRPASLDSNKCEVAKKNKTDEDVYNPVLLCTLNSNKSTKVNRKLSYEADKSTRFKRIRTPASDSDSEDEAPAKRKIQRFPKDDLTLEILSNAEKADPREFNSNPGLESQNSEGINYDDYLAEIMKKYEDNSSTHSSPLKALNILSPKQKKSQALTTNTKQDVSRLETVSKLSVASSKDTFKTASDSVACINLEDDVLNADQIFEDNLMKLEEDIRRYEKNTIAGQSSEIPDIIGGSEEVEPSPKRFKKIAVVPEIEKCNRPKDFYEIDDGFGENGTEVTSPSKKAKITIISDVKIMSGNNKEELKDQDDLFSDEDIVETTPQKKVDSFGERSVHSQMYTTPNVFTNLPDPLTETDNFEFGSAPLPPPPDFQDDVDIPPTPEKTDNEEKTTEGNVTVINVNQSSLTPDHLSQFLFRNHNNFKISQALSPCIAPYTKENEGENAMKITVATPIEQTINEQTLLNAQSTKKNITHSTPIYDVDLIRETLGFSPISARKSQKTGIMEMAESAKFTPLSCVKKSTPLKQNLLTSTPGQKSILNYVRLSQTSSEEGPVVKKTPCICYTRLPKAQIEAITQLTDKKLVTYNPKFDATVSHMIVVANENNCVRDYTIKFVAAVAAGIWVLRFQWVEECLNKNCIVPEEPYEVLDISGLPGPRTSRLTRNQNRLFKGYKFVCVEPFLCTSRPEVENILRMLDGKVLRELKDLPEDDGNIGIIIGEGHVTQDFEQYERWVEQYKTVTVDIEWLSKCVAQYKILSIRPYIWCSEDNLGDLGYPSVLTETVPYSFTETF